MGEIATAAAFFTYFVIMEVYGFSPSTLFFLLNHSVMLPTNIPTNSNVNIQTIFTFQDPNSTDFAYNFNTNQADYSLASGYWGCPYIASPQYICGNAVNKSNAFNENFPNWLSTINGQIDLRGFYVTCGLNSVNNQYVYNRIVPDQN
jgi:hypothetical protein